MVDEELLSWRDARRHFHGEDRHRMQRIRAKQVLQRRKRSAQVLSDPAPMRCALGVRRELSVTTELQTVDTRPRSYARESRYGARGVSIDHSTAWVCTSHSTPRSTGRTCTVAGRGSADGRRWKVETGDKHSIQKAERDSHDTRGSGWQDTHVHTSRNI